MTTATEKRKPGLRATSARKARAVEIMAQTGAYFRVAEELGIDAGTLARWRKKDPEFQRRLDHACVVEYKGIYMDGMIGLYMDRVQFGDVTEEFDGAGRLIRRTVKKTAAAVMDLLQRIHPHLHPKSEIAHDHQHTHQLVGILKRRQPRDITPQTPQTEDGRGEGARSGVSSTLPVPESGADQSHLPALLPEPAGAVGGGGAGREGHPPGGGAHAGAPVSPEATSPHVEEALDEDANRDESLGVGDEPTPPESLPRAGDGICGPDRGDGEDDPDAGG